MRALDPHFEKLFLRKPAGRLTRRSTRYLLKQELAQDLPAWHWPDAGCCLWATPLPNTTVAHHPGGLTPSAPGSVREASPMPVKRRFPGPCYLCGLRHLALCYSSPSSIFISHLASVWYLLERAGADVADLASSLCTLLPGISVQAALFSASGLTLQPCLCPAPAPSPRPESFLASPFSLRGILNLSSDSAHSMSGLQTSN